jgi:nucleotide-binding universal stress UspA family protein
VQALEAKDFVQRSVNKIMAVLDPDGEKSSLVLVYAAGLSKLCGASVTLVFPIDMPLVYSVQASPPALMSTPPPELWDGLEKEARAIIEQAKEEIASYGVQATGKVVGGMGKIGDAVSKLTDDFDLIVVPESKARGLERLFTKDLAVDLVHSAECPVVVVSSPSSRKRHR